MEQVNIINHKGEVVNNFPLNSTWWEVPLSKWNVSLANRAYLANQRQGTKKTKNKGEVSGSGIKPWRQKGTGRARSGSIRNPHFRGGGVAFGPQGNENYSLDINKKFKKKVLQSLLGEKMRNNEIVIVDKLELDNYKTQEAVKLLNNLPTKTAKTLLVLSPNETHKEKIIRSFRNLPYVNISDSKSINPLQTLNTNYLIFTHAALIETEQRLS